MKLYGDHYVIATDQQTGEVVFAEIFDTRDDEAEHLAQRVHGRYPVPRYRIESGWLRDNLPPLRGHPVENVATIALQTGYPLKVLLRAQQLETWRYDSLGTRMNGHVTRRRYVLVVALLAGVGLCLLVAALLGWMVANRPLVVGLPGR